MRALEDKVQRLENEKLLLRERIANGAARRAILTSDLERLFRSSQALVIFGIQGG